MRGFAHFILWGLFSAVCGTALILSAAYLYLNPQIPSAATFKNVKLRAPLRIYTADGKLIQEYGERLTPITYDQIPPMFVHALLDTEDKRFFEHGGIDPITVANATWQLIIHGGTITTGASTITMQLVKNISGHNQVTFLRKFKEMLLAWKLDHELTKPEILTLYVNIVPFGKHAFGVQAAANTYYGKNVNQLDLAQSAMLAGIPNAPSAGNPINGPVRAIERRNLVLLRMKQQGSITNSQYAHAIAQPITAKLYGRDIQAPAPYVAEMVRKRLLAKYGDEIYSDGLDVTTTISSHDQKAAQAALIKQLDLYDKRHGYRGPEHKHIKGTNRYLSAPQDGYPPNWVATLKDLDVIGDQHPAIVAAVHPHSIDVLTKKLKTITIPWSGLKWARPYITVNRRGPAPRTASDIVGPGDVIRIQKTDHGWILGQVPAIEGALVSLDPNDGAIKALVGGYDFNANQFDHVTQAFRQPGSNIKPFYYAGAITNGLTAASIFNDSPIVLPGGEQEKTYRPTNSGDTFHGNIRLREALYDSINLVSMRVLLDFGPKNALKYLQRFGFNTSNFPDNVQLALGGGTVAVSPLQVATGYAAFANGGFKVNPFIISSVTSVNHNVLYGAEPATVCRSTDSHCNPEFPKAKRIIGKRVCYIMNSILADVITKGTGARAGRVFKRHDLHGKTGTTNNADIWFSGFNNDLEATAWAGFDNDSPVGDHEWGSTTPLSTWIDYMKAALPPPSQTTKRPMPDGIVRVRIDSRTGLRTNASDPHAMFEIFRTGHVPPPSPEIADKNQKTEPARQVF